MVYGQVQTISDSIDIGLLSIPDRLFFKESNRFTLTAVCVGSLLISDYFEAYVKTLIVNVWKPLLNIVIRLCYDYCQE